MPLYMLPKRLAVTELNKLFKPFNIFNSIIFHSFEMKTLLSGSIVASDLNESLNLDAHFVSF